MNLFRAGCGFPILRVPCEERDASNVHASDRPLRVLADYFLTSSHNDSRSLSAVLQSKVLAETEITHNSFYWRILRATPLL